MGGGGHVVNASNGPRRLCAGGPVNADGGAVMVAASSTGDVRRHCHRRRWQLAAVSSMHVVGAVIVNVVVGSVDVDGRVVVAAADGYVIDVVGGRPRVRRRSWQGGGWTSTCDASIMCSFCLYNP